MCWCVISLHRPCTNGQWCLEQEVHRLPATHSCSCPGFDPIASRSCPKTLSNTTQAWAMAPASTSTLHVTADPHQWPREHSIRRANLRISDRTNFRLILLNSLPCASHISVFAACFEIFAAALAGPSSRIGPRCVEAKVSVLQRLQCDKQHQI